MTENVSSVHSFNGDGGHAMEQLFRAHWELQRSQWNFYAEWFRLLGFPAVFWTSRAERAVMEWRESSNGTHAVVTVDFNRR